jgi:hypothetical protein
VICLACLSFFVFCDLKTTKFHMRQGKILFGVLLNYEDGMEGEDDAVVERWIKVGQEVHPYTQ